MEFRAEKTSFLLVDVGMPTRQNKNKKTKTAKRSGFYVLREPKGKEREDYTFLMVSKSNPPRETTFALGVGLDKKK